MDATEASRSPWRFAAHVVRAVVADLRSRQAPVTTVLVGVLTAVFAWQVATGALAGVDAEAVAGYLFVEYPRRAWLLSFFLHRNVVHFGSNAVLLWFLGRVVEPTISERAFLAFVVVAAATSVVGGYLFTATLTDVPVAVYGASGLGFGLATYALLLPLQTAPRPLSSREPTRLLDPLTPAEELAVLVGLAATIQVLLDLATGPFFTAYWANGGHTVGAAAGLGAGLLASATARSSGAPSEPSDGFERYDRGPNEREDDERGGRNPDGRDRSAPGPDGRERSARDHDGRDRGEHERDDRAVGDRDGGDERRSGDALGAARSDEPAVADQPDDAPDRAEGDSD